MHTFIEVFKILIMKKFLFAISLFLYLQNVIAQTDTTHVGGVPKAAPKEDKPLKINLNEDGSHFFQVTFLNQVWIRENQSNTGTTVFGKAAPYTFDIGLRRTRMKMF